MAVNRIEKSAGREGREEAARPPSPETPRTPEGLRDRARRLVEQLRSIGRNIIGGSARQLDRASDIGLSPDVVADLSRGLRVGQRLDANAEEIEEVTRTTIVDIARFAGIPTSMEDEEGIIRFPQFVEPNAEDSDEERAKYVATATERICFGEEVQFDDLRDLLAYSEKDPVAKKVVEQALEKRLGSNQAARLLEGGPEFLSSLAELQKNLKFRVGARPGEPGSGVALLERAGLKSLLTIHETLGVEPQRLVQAFELGALSPEDHMELLPEQKRLIYIRNEGEVTVFLRYAENKGEITRTFKKVPGPRPGETRLVVDHVKFELDDGIKGKGIGKEVLRRSLEEYDRLGVDEIKLHANIDVGGYAWAKYGFGWDMPEELVTTTVLRIASRAEEGLDRLVKVGLFSPDDPEVQAAREEYAKFKNDPASVTPQDLAEAARDLRFVFVKEGRRFYRADDPKVKGKGRQMHLGQAAMMGSDWQGAMKISKGPGGEKTRERQLLETYLGM